MQFRRRRRPPRTSCDSLEAHVMGWGFDASASGRVVSEQERRMIHAMGASIEDCDCAALNNSVQEQARPAGDLRGQLGASMCRCSEPSKQIQGGGRRIPDRRGRTTQTQRPREGSGSSRPQEDDPRQALGTDDSLSPKRNIAHVYSIGKPPQPCARAELATIVGSTAVHTNLPRRRAPVRNAPPNGASNIWPRNCGARMIADHLTA